MVQTLPVLHSLKKTWPDCQVDWIVGEAAAGLLKGHPLLNRTVIYPRKRLGRLASNPLLWHRLALGICNLGKELRGAGYDASLDLQGLFKSGFITYLSGAGEKIGFAGSREASSVFLNMKIPPYDPDRHAVLRYLDMAAAIGADTREISFPLGLSAADYQNAGTMLKRLGLRQGSFIILIPGTVWPTKHWDADGFAKLSRLIGARLGLPSLVVGAKSDRALGDAISNKSGGNAINIAGATTLKLLAALFTMAATAVTVDTGPMHLAAAAGLKVVALFGPTAPWRTGPFGNGHIVIRKELDCNPCFNRQCESRKCMLEITPEKVVAAVEDICSIRPEAQA